MTEPLVEVLEERIATGEENIAQQPGLFLGIREALVDNIGGDLDQSRLVDAGDGWLEDDLGNPDPLHVQMDLMGLAKKVDDSVVLPTLPEIWTDHEKLKMEMEEVGFKQVHSERVPVEMSFETYEDLITLLMVKMPVSANLLKNFTDEMKARLRELILQEAKRLTPTAPYVLHGWAIVAVGRK